MLTTFPVACRRVCVAGTAAPGRGGAAKGGGGHTAGKGDNQAAGGGGGEVGTRGYCPWGKIATSCFRQFCM